MNTESMELFAGVTFNYEEAGDYIRVEFGTVGTIDYRFDNEGCAYAVAPETSTITAEETQAIRDLINFANQEPDVDSPHDICAFCNKFCDFCQDFTALKALDDCDF